MAILQKQALLCLIFKTWLSRFRKMFIRQNQTWPYIISKIWWSTFIEIPDKIRPGPFLFPKIDWVDYKSMEFVERVEEGGEPPLQLSGSPPAAGLTYRRRRLRSCFSVRKTPALRVNNLWLRETFPKAGASGNPNPWRSASAFWKETSHLSLVQTPVANAINLVRSSSLAKPF